MNREFISYPSTKHFKEMSSHLYQNGISEINFHGTVKLHGSNFTIVVDTNSKDFYFQTRNNVIEYYSSFYDFQEVFGIYSRELTNNLKAFFSSFIYNLKRNDVKRIIINGELIGDGVQKGVAVSSLSQRFVIFSVRLLGENINESLEGEKLKEIFNNSKEFPNIYCIENFKTWDITIKVLNSTDLLEKINILQSITEEVEKQCPVGLSFGVDGVGEGVVWSNDKYDLRFKVKGDEHTTSKVRTLKSVDLEKIKLLKTIDEFANTICTEARLKQGFQYFKENSTEDFNHKTFISWVIKDTYKEESDFINEKKLDEKMLNRSLSKIAYDYFLKNKE